MAKVPFTKLGLKKKDDIAKITINDIEIEVKQYLPVEEKINIVMNVLNNSSSDNSFANPMQVEVFANLEIVFAYTNLSFTDKQKEDPAKLYDLLEQNDIFNAVIDAMDEREYSVLIDWISETINSYYTYNNSALGILSQISQDYSNLNLDATEIQDKIANPENLTLLKDVMTKLG